MVVENVRAVLCRRREEKEEEEDFDECWASNVVELVRSGALTVVLRAALAKLRRAMALIVGDALKSLERGE